MLIKITDTSDARVFINENNIVLVKRGMQKGIHCWRVETNGDVVWFLPCDKNEPFGEWLKYQIGGEYWQEEVDRWTPQELNATRHVVDAKWATETREQ